MDDTESESISGEHAWQGGSCELGFMTAFLSFDNMQFYKVSILVK